MKHKLTVWIYNLIVISMLALSGCSDDKDEPSPTNNGTPCIVTSAPSYFGTSQTFEYDQQGMLLNRKYDFNYPGYSQFVQTVDSKKTFYSYSTQAGLVEVTDIFVGGSGNLFDGTPSMVISRGHQTYTNGSPEFFSGPDTLLTFQYDDLKRLSSVTYHYKLLTDDISIIYGQQLYSMVLDLTYDANDNATRLTQTLVVREGVYNVNKPADSYFVFKESVQTLINVTYDTNPSPYSVMSKYWKFVQGDWGYVVNSNWTAIIAALSKNNPLTIQYETYKAQPSKLVSSFVYTYNEQGFPTSNYTYTCQ